MVMENGVRLHSLKDYGRLVCHRISRHRQDICTQICGPGHGSVRVEPTGRSAGRTMVGGRGPTLRLSNLENRLQSALLSQVRLALRPWCRGRADGQVRGCFGCVREETVREQVLGWRFLQPR